MRTEDCNVELVNAQVDELDDKHEDEEGSTIRFCVLAAKAGRGVAELPVNMQTWNKKILHKKHLILDGGWRESVLGKDN